MRQKIYVLLGLLLVIGTILILWWKQSVQPVNPNEKTPVVFTINKGESVRNIAEKLQKEGLIRSALSFFLLARFGGTADNIQAGDFRLNPAMNLYSVATALSHGTTDVWLTIPEGFRKEEIATKIAHELAIPETEFNKVAKEGYMFPDTYLIPKEATATGVVSLFLANFNYKITSAEIEKAKQRSLSLDEVIIIASLVEREAKLTADRPMVGSVIINRLKIGMKLDIDATIQYALGYQGSEKTWWKKNLTVEDLDIDSPFNTYKNPGLPPTPIANPGLAAIKAVIEAPDTNYLYYVSDKTGKLHFAKTIEEHDSNIAKYLNK